MTAKESENEEGRPEGRDEEHVIIPFGRPEETRPARRAREADSETPEPGELSREEIKRIVEALLFAAGSPLSNRRLHELTGVGGGGLVRSIVEELKAEYDGRAGAFTLENIAEGHQFLTRPEFEPWVRKLRQKEHEDSLSQAALETLAIVAYRQPIMRAEIEDIRGVQSGYILRSLIEKSLIRVAGRSEELGRPLLYGTTGKFLEVFGLASLKDLPKLEELRPPSDAQ